MEYYLAHIMQANDLMGGIAPPFYVLPIRLLIVPVARMPKLASEIATNTVVYHSGKSDSALKPRITYGCRLGMNSSMMGMEYSIKMYSSFQLPADALAITFSQSEMF